jgi:hypothetical protein
LKVRDGVFYPAASEFRRSSSTAEHLGGNLNKSSQNRDNFVARAKQLTKISLFSLLNCVPDPAYLNAPRRWGKSVVFFCLDASNAIDVTGGR